MDRGCKRNEDFAFTVQIYKVYFDKCYIDTTIVSFLRKESTIIRNNDKKVSVLRISFRLAPKQRKQRTLKKVI